MLGLNSIANDPVAAPQFDENANTDTVQSGDVPDGWMVRS